jgi:hypothetical protein
MLMRIEVSLVYLSIAREGTVNNLPFHNKGIFKLK